MMKLRNIFVWIGLLIAIGLTGAACTPKTVVVNSEFVLTTEMAGGSFAYVGVNGTINGVTNPALEVQPGERVTILLVNSGEGTHDVVFDALNLRTDQITKKGETTSITFNAPTEAGAYEYRDSTHDKLGMKGVLLVGDVLPDAATVKAEPQAAAPEAPAAGSGTDMAAIAQIVTKGGCSACHNIPGVDGAVGVIGPSLADASAMAAEHLKSADYSGHATDVAGFIKESIVEPDAYIAPACPSGPCTKGLMPANLSSSLRGEEVDSLVTYLAGLPNSATASQAGEGNQSMEMPASAAVAGAVDIVRDPTDLPAPLPNRAAQNLRVDLETIEVAGQLADGTTYTYWTFGGKVPGPFIRTRVGDTVEVHLKNAANSSMTHSVDFHAVTGPGGGAVSTQTQPGGETMFTFKGLNPGLYVYHCATPMVAQHISNGMYGLILVEPVGGLPKVDKEFYVMQGELYTSQPFGTQGNLTGDTATLLDEHPEYFVFNGASMALAGENHMMHASTGETVRIFFGVGGPNFTSAFHVIGEIFDRVYDQASLTSPALTDVQTTLVPPGGATMVEFALQVPGRYILVDHALSRLQRGLAGFLMVDGEANLEVFNGEVTAGSGH